MNNRRCSAVTLLGGVSFFVLILIFFNLSCDSQEPNKSPAESLDGSATYKIPPGWTQISQLTGGRVSSFFVHGSEI